tara:strand:- start:139 stop:750 length:612 start_codon:yes stop_codon:yes gene_type:complete
MAVYGEDAVAGMAIVGRLVPVAFGVIFALSGAIGPIIGQNFGARNMDRVRGAFRDGLIFTATVVVLISLVLFLLRAPIAALFQADGVARDLIYLFSGPLALAWFFNGMLFVSNASFNNLGHPYTSTWMNWGRHTLGTIPFVIFFSWWLGAEGVLIGQAVGGVIFGLLAAVLALRLMSQADLPYGPPQPFQRQARLLQLFHNRR